MGIASEYCALSLCPERADRETVAAGTPALLNDAGQRSGIRMPIAAGRRQPRPSLGPIGSATIFEKCRSDEPIDVRASEATYGDEVAQGPGLSTKTEDLKLQRKLLAMVYVEIHAAHERFHPSARLSWKRRFNEGSGPRQVKRAQRLVERDSQRPEHFRSAAKCDTPEYFHLSEAQVRMDEPERESGIPVVFSDNVWNLMPVKMNSHRRTKR